LTCVSYVKELATARRRNIEEDAERERKVASAAKGAALATVKAVTLAEREAGITRKQALQMGRAPETVHALEKEGRNMTPSPRQHSNVDIYLRQVERVQRLIVSQFAVYGGYRADACVRVCVCVCVCACVCVCVLRMVCRQVGHHGTRRKGRKARPLSRPRYHNRSCKHTGTPSDAWKCVCAVRRATCMNESFA